MLLEFWASGVGVFIGISVPGGDFSSKVLQSFCFPAGLGDPFPFPSSTGSSWEWEHLAFPRCRRAEPGWVLCRESPWGRANPRFSVCPVGSRGRSCSAGHAGDTRACVPCPDPGPAPGGSAPGRDGSTGPRCHHRWVPSWHLCPFSAGTSVCPLLLPVCVPFLLAPVSHSVTCVPSCWHLCVPPSSWHLCPLPLITSVSSFFCHVCVLFSPMCLSSCHLHVSVPLSCQPRMLFPCHLCVSPCSCHLCVLCLLLPMSLFHKWDSVPGVHLEPDLLLALPGQELGCSMD